MSWSASSTCGKCSAAYSGVMGLLSEKQSEIAVRIADLQEFSDRLDTTLACCIPDGADNFIPVELLHR